LDIYCTVHQQKDCKYQVDTLHIQTLYV